MAPWSSDNRSPIQWLLVIQVRHRGPSPCPTEFRFWSFFFLLYPYLIVFFFFLLSSNAASLYSGTPCQVKSLDPDVTWRGTSTHASPNRNFSILFLYCACQGVVHIFRLHKNESCWCLKHSQCASSRSFQLQIVHLCSMANIFVKKTVTLMKLWGMENTLVDFPYPPIVWQS